MVEIVFVFPPVAFLHAVESRHFGQDDFEQTAAIQIDKSTRRVGRKHDFIEFVDNAFRRDDLYAFAVALQRFERLFLDLKIELRGKSHAAHHAKRVVTEGNVRIERCGHDAIFQIIETSERIDELS